MPSIAMLTLGLAGSVFLATMGCALYFNHRIAPAALRKWADERNCEILHVNYAGLFESMFIPRGGGQQIYRETLRDRSGDGWECLIRVGQASFPCRKVEHCPVELIRRKAVTPPLPSKPNSKAKPSHDWEFD